MESQLTPGNKDIPPSKNRQKLPPSKERESLLAVLTTAYLKGDSVNWDSLYENAVYGDVPIFNGDIPTYPFERKRRWVPWEDEGAIKTEIPSKKEVVKDKGISPVKQALGAIRKLKQQINNIKAEQTQPIAVIGMGCRFPGGADTPRAYWDLLRQGRDAIVEVPKYRWDIDTCFDADPDAPGKMYCRYGGFLGPVDGFDTLFFGLSPRESARMDPQHRLVLEVAWETLEQAGMAPSKLHGAPVGVFLGTTALDYGCLLFGQGDLTKVDAFSGTGGTLGPAAGRLSYLMGFTGPSFVLDTACSSSLVAVHLACQSLRNRECTMAIAGGVNLTLSPAGTVNFCKARMLAPDGRCKSFDASANGYVRGEGCGMVLLKRLSDVDPERDRVLAVIRGSAVNQDGPSGGFTVPSGPAQERVIRKAMEVAGVTPDEIDYVEAHGTGTALGDPIEVEALGSVFRENKDPLLIGSVKTNFGHLEAAAGMASLIKVILSLNHNLIPPHLHFKSPNPRVQWDDLPIRVNTQSTSWTDNHKMRLAGISCFGFSGTNAHIIVGDPPASSDLLRTTVRTNHTTTRTNHTTARTNHTTARTNHSELHDIITREAVPPAGEQSGNTRVIS
ncbi:MAG: polyketide synthase, partial [Desulfamplus sp.]|nr:polyketide synthase [Desulfamplus sp.]